jgi:hypothetical protein
VEFVTKSKGGQLLKFWPVTDSGISDLKIPKKTQAWGLGFSMKKFDRLKNYSAIWQFDQ